MALMERGAAMRQAALDAEWDVPEGTVGQVIRQLRRRGRVATGRAALILFILIIVIFTGLAYYLGLPYWQQFVDGSRTTLADTRAAIRAELDALDDARDALVWGEAGLQTAQSLQFAATHLETGTDAFLTGHYADDTQILLYGDYGTILRSADGGARFDLIETGTDASLERHYADDTQILLYGDYGTILDLSDEWRIAAENLELPKGPEGDTALLTFLDVDLPDHVASADDVSPLREQLIDIIAQRAILPGRLTTVEADLRVREDTPEWLLDQGTRREEFAAFMATCRGTTNWDTPPEPRGITDADPDAITLACTAAYQAQLAADEDNVWETIARIMPPGVLILFLLVTLGGLYRYNMRLAGFHHSRADLLSLAAMGREPGAAFSDKDWLNIRESAAALAADMVEFGTSKAGVGPQGVSFELSKLKPGGG